MKPGIWKGGYWWKCSKSIVLGRDGITHLRTFYEDIVNVCTLFHATAAEVLPGYDTLSANENMHQNQSSTWRDCRVGREWWKHAFRWSIGNSRQFVWYAIVQSQVSVNIMIQGDNLSGICEERHQTLKYRLLWEQNIPLYMQRRIEQFRMKLKDQIGKLEEDEKVGIWYKSSLPPVYHIQKGYQVH